MARSTLMRVKLEVAEVIQTASHYTPQPVVSHVTGFPAPSAAEVGPGNALKSAHMPAAPHGPFPHTRHTIVADLRSDREEVRRSAFDALVAAYWKPVFK